MQVYHFPPKASEFTTSIILLLWSLIVFTGGEALSTAYQTISSVRTWAFLFGVLSVFRIAILCINGNLRRSPHFRSVLSLITCFAWFQITIAFIESETLSTGLAVYPVLLLLDFYNGFRIAVEARITDESYKNAGTDD